MVPTWLLTLSLLLNESDASLQSCELGPKVSHARTLLQHSTTQNFAPGNSQREEVDGATTIGIGRSIENNSYTILATLSEVMASDMVEELGGKQPIQLQQGNLHVATVETRGKVHHRLYGPLGWDWSVLNLGAGKTWNGFRTKIVLMQQWVATLPDDDIVAFVDGGDVMYGGCDLDDFRSWFHMLSTTTGAPVIFGAEYNCYKPPTGGCSKYPIRKRDAVLQLFGIDERAIDSWGNSTAQIPKFLNSGFYVGKVFHLRRLYNAWLRHEFKHDQQQAAKVFQDFPDLVALDYATVLVNNLYALRLEKHDSPLFEWNPTKEKWFNTLTGKDVCFFHGNGPAKGALKYLARTNA